MPPKKRVRDVDDEELDKEEVKGMLRQSLDERAELVVKNEELNVKMEEMQKEHEKELDAKKKELAAERKEMKKKVAEQEKEKDKQLIEKAQLYAADVAPGRASGVVFYRNPHLLRQATAVNKKSLLDITGQTGIPCGQEEVLYFLKVESSKDLVKIFEDGVPVGTELETEGHFDPKKVLFSVAVMTHSSSPSNVAEGQQSLYLPVSARSTWSRFNYPLARHLEQSAPFPQELRPWKYLHMEAERYFSQEVQDAAEGAAYDAVVDDVWVRKAGKEDEALKYKLDLNKMVAVRGDTSINIGFHRSKLPDGTTFQPGGRRNALMT